MEPQELPQSESEVPQVSRSDKKLIIIGSFLLIIILIIAGYFLLNKNVPNNTDTENQNVIFDNSQIPQQQELGMIEEKEIPPAPFFSEFNVDGISPNVSANEVGKKYKAYLPTHLPVGGVGEMTVTVKKAAKYYPIKTNEFQSGLVYFPSCSTKGCFDGKQFPIEVQPKDVIISLDLQFYNSSEDTFSLRGYYYSRFKVNDEYIKTSGSNITTNRSTGHTERFTDSPDLYIDPLSSQTVTFWVEVPHNLEAIKFVYGGQTESNNMVFNSENPSLTIPLTFSNL